MFNRAKFFLSGCLTLFLSACATVQTESSYVPISAKPTVAKNNLSEKFACYERKIKSNYYILSSYKEHSLGLFVKDIVDGTVVPNSGLDGSLADSGRLQMLSSLGKLFPDNLQIVIGYNFPRALENTAEGVNRLGYLSPDDYQNFSQGQLHTINNYLRKVNDKTPFVEAKTTDFYIIEGAFSRNDADDGVMNDGKAGSVEYERTTKAGVELGKTKSRKYVSLTIIMAHPFTNMVTSSETFELSLDKNKSTAELKLGRSNINTGITVEKEQIESIHSAQQLLIDYAALWIAEQYAHNNPILYQELKKC